MLRTHKRIIRRIRIATLALALGTATPAVAMPIDGGLHLSSAPPLVNTQPSVPSVGHRSSSGGVDWGYVAAGTGVVSLALIGLGGSAVGRRQRRTRSSTITA